MATGAKILIAGLPNTGKTTLLKSLKNAFVISRDGKPFSLPMPHVNVPEYTKIDDLLDLVQDKLTAYEEKFKSLPDTICFDSVSRIFTDIEASCSKRFHGYDVWSNVNKEINTFLDALNSMQESGFNLVLIAHAVWDVDAKKFIETCKGSFAKTGGFLSTVDYAINIDIVVFELGGNDANYEMSVDSVKANIEHLYNAFVEDNPNCKVVVTIVPTWCNTMGGTRTNGGAAFDIEHAKPYHWGYIKMFFEHFVGNSDFPNMRVAFCGPQIDRYYGWSRRDYTISKYITEKVSEGDNLYHPSTVGYNQYAEAFLSELLALY